MAQMMGALGAMQGQPGAPAKAVQAIHWQSLSQALPVSAPGWALKEQVKGETAQVMGIAVSQSSCRLVQGAMTAKVEIIDTTFNPVLAMPFNMARTVVVDSSEEKVGPINFGTHPGHQKFDKRQSRAEVTVLVAGRILVTVKVDKVQSEVPAQGVMQYVNFAHLASLVGS
jgi:hypothetical protein